MSWLGVYFTALLCLFSFYFHSSSSYLVSNQLCVKESFKPFHRLAEVSKGNRVHSLQLSLTKNPPLMAEKIGMISIFDKKEHYIPVTILFVFPITVTQIQRLPHCDLVQFGYNAKQKFKLTKPELGHLLTKNLPKLQHLKEVKVDHVDNYTAGQVIGLDRIQLGDTVSIQGKSIGKGNQGPVKRHGFRLGPATHGSKHHRLQGSLGAGTDPGRVFPGKRMAGRMGGGLVTMKNLVVMDVDIPNNLLIVKGSIPGKAGNLVAVNYYTPLPEL
jgi:large subunit ribosomal protein L3